MFDKDKVAQPIDSCIEFITTASYIFKRMHNNLYVGVWKLDGMIIDHFLNDISRSPALILYRDYTVCILIQFTGLTMGRAISSFMTSFDPP